MQKISKPSLSQTLNNFPETKHYFLLRNSSVLVVSVLVVWTHIASGSVVISRERFEFEFCLPGWLSSNIIVDPFRKRSASFYLRWTNKALRKTSHSVTKSEQCLVLVSSFHGLQMERLGPWPPFHRQGKLPFFLIPLSYTEAREITYSSWLVEWNTAWFFSCLTYLRL